ncbi:MAG: hypothetical protein RLZZ200_363 [Pseudomonadota bacterium]
MAQSPGNALTQMGIRSDSKGTIWLAAQVRLFHRLWQDVHSSIACLWLLDRLVGRFLPFRTLVIPLFDRIDCLADHAVLPAGYRLKPARRETMERVAAQHPEALTQAFIDEALSKGDTPFVIFRGEDVAEFHWFATTPTRMFAGVWIHPPIDRLYSYKGYVMPAYRGNALHSLGKRVRAQELSRAQLKGIVSFVEVSNTPSLLSAAKIPGQRFGFAIIWPKASGLWAYRSPACRKAGIQFTGGAQASNSPSMTSQSPTRL